MQTLIVRSYGRQYTLVLGAVSERIPQGTRFARARYLARCAQFHEADYMLLSAETVYLSAEPGVSIAAQLEQILATQYRHDDGQADIQQAMICVIFDDCAYVCEYHMGLVCNERVLSTTQTRAYLHEQSNVLSIHMGAGTDLEADMQKSGASAEEQSHVPALQKLRLDRSLHYRYRFRKTGYAMLLAGLPMRTTYQVAICAMCLVALAFQLLWVEGNATVPVPPPIVENTPTPETTDKATRYASTASTYLNVLNHLLTQLHGFAHHINVDALALKGDVLRLRTSKDSLPGTDQSWVLTNTNTNTRTSAVRKVEPMRHADIEQLRRSLLALPGTRLEDWGSKKELQAHYTQTRLRLNQGISWHLAMISQLLSGKPARLALAHIDFDARGRAHSAQLTIELAGRAG
jgi:hypothetical protein